MYWPHFLCFDASLFGPSTAAFEGTCTAYLCDRSLTGTGVFDPVGLTAAGIADFVFGLMALKLLLLEGLALAIVCLLEPDRLIYAVLGFFLSAAFFWAISALT